MANWTIDKTFDFCYGHRVWTQKLNENFSDDLKCACRHLHGHQGKVQVFLTNDKLDNTGMITDFRHLEWLKKLINSIIDHRFIIDKNDPLYEKIIGKDKVLQNEIIINNNGSSIIIGQSIALAESNLIPNTPDYEYYEGMLLVDFPPTSENLSKWLAEFVNFKMQDLNVKVTRVDWWETPKSRSTYEL